MENSARPRPPTAFASQNQATPLKTRAASIYVPSFPCTSTHIYRGTRTITMAREVEGHIVGPMALKDFVEKFLPLSNGVEGITVHKTKLKSMKHDIRKVEDCKNEVEMYEPLIDAITPLCKKFVPYDTHAKPLRNFDGMDVKPDICFYDKKHLASRTLGISAVEMIAEVKYNLNDDAFVCMDALKPSQDLRPETQTPSTPIEPDEAMLTETTLLANDANEDQDSVEETEEYDEDDDHEDYDDDNDDDDNQNRKPDPKQFESDINRLSSQGRDTLGQITTYTAAQKAAQFRKHIFSLLIFKKHGRLLFWDWSGVVVTDRFPLTDDYFAEFFWRYNKTGSQRGLDETIELLGARERAAVLKLGLFKDDARLVKIPVWEQDGKKSFYVVEQPYFMGGISPFGRSTRGFEAYSLDEIHNVKGTNSRPKKLFLKDTWRITGRFFEHEFYDRLRTSQVPYVATYRQAYDVPNQETIVQRIYKVSEAYGQPTKIRRFHHYRMVFEQYASDLSTFRSTKELVSVFHQALQAHQKAYEAGVLHRDISVGNIMISEPDSEGNRQGLLVDWDMAKFTKDQTVGTMERTGTWQFLAARFLQNPQDTTPANFDDDLESFVYVLTWMVFRYTEVAFSPVELYDTMHDIFNKSYLNADGQVVGGRGKFGYLDGRTVLKGAKIKNQTLHSLLRGIKDVVAVRYEDENEEGRPLPSWVHRPDALPRENKEILKTPEWMISFFELALSIEEPRWPEDDAAKLNPMQMPAHDTVSLKCSTALMNIAVDSDGRKSKRSRKD